MYKRLSNLEEKELEVIWLKIMPKKVPRKLSCILLQHSDDRICQNA